MLGNAEDDPLIDRSNGKKQKASSNKSKDAGGAHTTHGMGQVSKEVLEKSMCGTTEGSVLWLNMTDWVGIVFASVVWIASLYAFSCWIVLYMSGQISFALFLPAVALVFMSLWSHLATMMGDPGAVPWNAHPIEMDRKTGAKLLVCGHCDSYKPPLAHHDRVSGRCISRMDHFCPWMNNAIGAGNQKNFLLFLIYTDLASMYMYAIVAVHLVDDDIAFTGTGLVLARVLIFLLLFAILFTSSMIANQCYGIVIGLGTIDRMKLRTDDDTVRGLTVPWRHVFGEEWLPWILPIDPYFPRPDLVFRYKLKDYGYGRTV
jgi:hypothetical protein